VLHEVLAFSRYVQPEQDMKSTDLLVAVNGKKGEKASNKIFNATCLHENAPVVRCGGRKNRRFEKCCSGVHTTDCARDEWDFFVRCFFPVTLVVRKRILFSGAFVSPASRGGSH
jgi:hypothetical protein